MGWLEGRHDGRQILLPVAILGSDDPSDLTHTMGVALLDTGSTTSAVSPRIIAQLGLIANGKRLMRVATEERMVERYLFRVGLFEKASSNVASTRFPYVFAECNGFAIRSADHFDVILGMDVLGQCDFSADRKGYWRIGYG